MALVNHILIATDFSACSERAVEYGASLAKQFGARVVLVHVYAPPVIVVPEAVIPLGAAELQKMLDRMNAGLAAAADKVRSLGVGDVETVLVDGDAWHEIVRLANDRSCDMIVVGTHGHGAIKHFFLGSVAERVVRKAACPVLVVGRQP